MPSRDDGGAPHDAAKPGDGDRGDPLVVLPPTRIGALAGPFYTPVPGQEALPFFGTDLGVSFRFGDEERVLFGDTWVDANGTLLGATHDDCQGSISLDAATGFADGDAVDRFVEGRVGSEELPAWGRGALPLRLEETTDGTVAPIELYRGARQGARWSIWAWARRWWRRSATSAGGRSRSSGATSRSSARAARKARSCPARCARAKFAEGVFWRPCVRRLPSRGSQGQGQPS